MEELEKIKKITDDFIKQAEEFISKEKNRRENE